MSKTVILILNLAITAFGILIIWLTYQKEAVAGTAAAPFFAKRIFILGVIIGLLNFVNHLIKYSTEKKPAIEQYIDKKFFDYFGEKPKNPPVEEAKSEIEKELKAAFEKQVEAFKKTVEKKEQEALRHYEKGNSAYANNQFKDAINHFENALELVKVPSFYLSLGNSYYVTSDYRTALMIYQTALVLYGNSKEKKGEGNALGNLGRVYDALGRYDKAIDYHEQALAIAREIGDRRGEGSDLGNLGVAYRSIGLYDCVYPFHFGGR